jgi:malonate-semialdehyde dehydrogenase (acetylating)/methylmalonate-semialdehyde dehydrogenase
VVVPVGEATAVALREKLLAAIATLRIGASTDPGAHFGPLINAAHREKVSDYIQLGVDEGAELVLDGRGFALAGHEQGYFLGPSLFDHVREDMRSYREEIFGPVLQILRADSFEEALGLPSRHQYGNGVAIFTRNGDAAREFADRVEVGMVGINVPIPVPVSYYSFGGWNDSLFGDLHMYGPEGVQFYTRAKVVTSRWPDPGTSSVDLGFPRTR